jgi:hypothetical protein
LGLGVWHRYYWTPHVELQPQAAAQRFKLHGLFCGSADQTRFLTSFTS